MSSFVYRDFAYNHKQHKHLRLNDQFDTDMCRRPDMPSIGSVNA